MDPLPASSTAPQLPPKRGGCCCAGGCATMLVIGLVGLALLIAATWYVYGKAISTFTSSAPAEVRTVQPTDAEFVSVDTRIEQMRAAAAQNQAAAFEFTADDLNALIARHPKFKELRGRVYVTIENSVMQLNLSVPLASASLPGLSSRWFNATAKLGLSYDDGNFDFALRSLTANGRDIPLSVLPALDTTFNQTINESFDKSQRENRADEEMWEHVQSVKVVGDKLVVTTKGGEVPSVPSPSAQATSSS